MKSLCQTTLAFPRSQGNGPWLTLRMVNQEKGCFFKEKEPKNWPHASSVGKGALQILGERL